MEAWHEIDRGGALAVLGEWVGRRVVVAVDAADAPPELAGMSGTLRAGGADAFELEGGDSWFRVPDDPWFHGASYAAEKRVLVLEVGGSAGSGPLLVEVQAR